jgi:hypothetical protein
MTDFNAAPSGDLAKESVSKGPERQMPDLPSGVLHFSLVSSSLLAFHLCNEVSKDKTAMCTLRALTSSDQGDPLVYLLSRLPKIESATL